MPQEVGQRRRLAAKEGRFPHAVYMQWRAFGPLGADIRPTDFQRVRLLLKSPARRPSIHPPDTSDGTDGKGADLLLTAYAGLQDKHGQTLLRAAVQSSYEKAPGAWPAGNEWFHYARSVAPLWSFNPWAFQTIREGNLPSSFPLGLIVESIASQEGQPFESICAAPTLVEELYARRASLGRSGAAWGQNADAYPRLHHLDQGDPADPHYLFLGLDLVVRVEALESAQTKRERATAQSELDAFLKGLGAELSQGRPRRGPPDAILLELFRQGAWLLGVCWAALPVGPSDATREALATEGCETEQQQSQWAMHLALPMLSRPELEQMLDGIAKPLGRGKLHTRPRRATVRFLAARLGVEVTTLANKLPPRSDRDYFRT